MTGSLAYRKNEAEILRGNVPDKYLRLLPYITGPNILEIGSAEGVLALLLAKKGNNVTALERNPERHAKAIELGRAWGAQCDFRLGDIRENGTLLEGKDTLVAVRMIYYLRNDLDMVFDAISAKVGNVVLCGNKNRAKWWVDGVPDKIDGAVNYYASAEGMKDVLQRHGYRIETEVNEGDPIIVASR